MRAADDAGGRRALRGAGGGGGAGRQFTISSVPVKSAIFGRWYDDVRPLLRRHLGIKAELPEPVYTEVPRQHALRKNDTTLPPPPAGRYAKCCNEFVSVRWHLTTRSNFTKFSVHAACDSGYVVRGRCDTLRYALAVLWITSCFHTLDRTVVLFAVIYSATFYLGQIWTVFTARRLAKRGICRRRVSVCVCLSHSGIVSKRLNVGSRKQRRTIAP